MHYTFMFEFEADNDMLAENVLGQLHESILDISEGDTEGIRFGGQALISGRRISETEWDNDRLFESKMNEYYTEGINKNPLPEDFPTI